MLFLNNQKIKIMLFLLNNEKIKIETFFYYFLLINTYINYLICFDLF